MVHALKEIHRILKPHGTLIDLRPYLGSRPVLVELAYATLLAGEIDSSARISDNHAADAAIQQMVDDDIFKREHQTTFNVVTDLDTVADLREYATSFIRSVLPERVVEQVETLIAGEDEDYSIHIHRPMMIARYRKR